MRGFAAYPPASHYDLLATFTAILLANSIDSDT